MLAIAFRKQVRDDNSWYSFEVGSNCTIVYEEKIAYIHYQRALSLEVSENESSGMCSLLMLLHVYRAKLKCHGLETRS